MDDVNKIIQLIKTLIAENKDTFPKLRGYKNWNSVEEIRQNFQVLKNLALDALTIIKAACGFVLGDDGKLNANDKERIVRATASAVNAVVDIPIAPEWLEQLLFEMLLSLAWDAVDSIKDKIFGDKFAAYSAKCAEIRV